MPTVRVKAGEGTRPVVVVTVGCFGVMTNGLGAIVVIAMLPM